MTRQGLLLTAVVCLASLAAGPRPAAAPADEPPPTFTAAQLLTATEIKGRHHTVAGEVRTDGFFHEFTVETDFGAFEASGLSMLAVRLRETGALAELQDVSKTEAFLSAAGQSVVNVGKSVTAAVTDPVDTVKGIGTGIKRFAVNLGRRTKRVVDSVKAGDPAAESKPDGNVAASAAKSLLGVNGAARRWARKLAVDPYTTNMALRKALDDIGKVDAAGSIASKIVMPVPSVVGMTATVGDLVWGQDPEELRKFNEKRMKQLDVPDEAAKRLTRNSAMTLTYQTRLIGALHAVRVPGAADRIASAAESRNEREALFHVESAEFLRERHAQSPFTAILQDSLAMVAVAADGRAFVLMPIDWLRWTEAAESELSEIDARAGVELKASSLTVVLTDTASELAAKEIGKRGWKLEDGGR